MSRAKPAPTRERWLKNSCTTIPNSRGLLRESGEEELLSPTVPALPADHEARTLCQTKRVAHGNDSLHFLAILFTCFAFGRILSDTSFDVSPRNFIITSAIASVLWVAYYVRMAWLRRKVYRIQGG